MAISSGCLRQLPPSWLCFSSKEQFHKGRAGVGRGEDVRRWWCRVRGPGTPVRNSSVRTQVSNWFGNEEGVYLGTLVFWSKMALPGKSDRRGMHEGRKQKRT